MLCHAVLCCIVSCYATLCRAVQRNVLPCHTALCYSVGEQRQTLEAFIAAFGVDAAGSPATSSSHADPVLQVSHAVTIALHIYVCNAVVIFSFICTIIYCC